MRAEHAKENLWVYTIDTVSFFVDVPLTGVELGVGHPIDEINIFALNSRLIPSCVRYIGHIAKGILLRQ